MSDVRLIERWLPIAEIGVESTRERTPMTPFPAPNRLHVWWARRPLVASRAAVLASLLPADADRSRFLHMLGIHGDPVASRRRIDAARRKGERFEGQAYSYPRAFSHVPDDEARHWLTEALGRQLAELVVLDPTAGGGSIPFEASRLGLGALANDLNPVAALIMRATAQWPCDHGHDLKREFERLAARFVEIREELLAPWFPAEPKKNTIPTNYLWARTVTCPYCDGLVPLSPNWRLVPDGTGVRLKPRVDGGAGGDLYGPLPVERGEAGASGPRDDDDPGGTQAFPRGRGPDPTPRPATALPTPAWPEQDAGSGPLWERGRPARKRAEGPPHDTAGRGPRTQGPRGKRRRPRTGGGCAGSRSSGRPASSRPARWRAATGSARFPTAGASSTGT